MRIDSVTDIGSTRKENQDNYWSAILDIDGVETGIVCMCDGMGGLANGGLASSTVVRAVRNAILEGIELKDLEIVIKDANQAVYNLSQSGSRMGTTCTLLICRKGKYFSLHVGDSRCYQIFPSWEIQQISCDHSFIAKKGITKEDGELYEKYKSKLIRCIGVKPEVEVDFYKGTYNIGDMFLLCSDGFWHTLEDNIFGEKDSELPLENLSSMVQTCMECGEKDNITVSVLYT